MIIAVCLFREILMNKIVQRRKISTIIKNTLLLWTKKMYFLALSMETSVQKEHLQD